jgi:hypothetical protein
LSSSWTRVTHTFPLLAGADFFKFEIYDNTSSWPVGEGVDIDAAMVNKGATAGTYNLNPFSQEKRVLDESVYNPRLVVDFDTDRCINSVGVLRQWTHASEGPQGTLYGPYTNDTSIAEWGRHHAEIDVAGTNPASIPAFAASVLAANSVPQVQVQSLQIPVMDDAHLAYAFTDLYDLVNVVNAKTSINTDMRVTAISHTIRATEDGGEWLMDFEFAKSGGIATPTQQPPLSTITPTTAPLLIMQKNGSAQGLTASTWTTVSGWTIQTNSGFASVSGSAVTIAVPGMYFISFTVGYNSGTSRCLTAATLNSESGSDGVLAREDNESSSARIGHNVSAVVRCVAGDVLRGLAYSTAARNVEQNLSAINVYRIGD